MAACCGACPGLGRASVRDAALEYEIIRSSRKTVSLEITRDGRLLVRSPAALSDERIRQFVADHADWIAKHLPKQTTALPSFTMEEIHRLAEQALTVLPLRVKHFAKLIGVTYGRITIRNQRSRWGSCSGEGNLNFNCLLMLAPQEVQDYVVVHELCHRKEMNHSPRFWAEVERILPDYKQRRKWLKDNGGALIARMP